MILSVWLKMVPEYAPLFLRLSMFGTLVFLLGNTMYIAASATGRIRKYPIYVTIIGCLVFPVTWIAYKMGSPVYVTYLVYIAIYLALVFVRLYILKGLIGFPVMMFVRDVMGRLLIVTPTAFALPGLIAYYLESSWGRLILICVVSVVSTSICIYTFGLERAERAFVVGKVVHTLKNKMRRK